MAKAAIRMIPLNKLVASTRNVRSAAASETDDAELYASIRHNGLKQNLLVHEGENGAFHVHAGGRRLKALQRLAEDGHIKADEKIACRVEAKDLAEESSTIENLVRSAMHPADEFAAFAALVDKGQSIDDVALKFGVPVSRVEKRLKLARVAPAILDRFRAGEITLECVMAFTLTDDHKRQVALWEQIVASYCQPSPTIIRRMLMDTATAGGSKYARFVGREAYEAAGGTVTEDLFSDRDSIYFEDAALLERLVNDKLEAVAEELRGQSWKWAEARLEVDYGDYRKFGRVYPTALPLDPAIEEEYDTLRERLRRFQEDYDEDSWTEELQQEEEEAERRFSEIEDMRAASVEYSQEQKAIAGCIVTLDYGGDLKVEGGLVRPEDIPAGSDADGEETGEADDGEGAPHIDMPRMVGGSTVTLNPVEASRKEQGQSQSLTEDLRASRHQILQAHLAAEPETAFDLLVYSMCRRVFDRSYYGASPVRVSLTHAEVSRSREVLRDTIAARMLEATHKGLDLRWMEEETPKDFEAFSALPTVSKHALLAWCTSNALEQQLANDVGATPVIEVAARRMNVDVAACWRPTAAIYWNRVKKGHALDTARQLIGDRWADDKSGDRKADIAASMECAFCEDATTRAGLTADTARRTAAWLPDGMGVGEAAEEDNDAEAVDTAAAESDVGADDAATDEDKAEDLPAFLSETAE